VTGTCGVSNYDQRKFTIPRDFAITEIDMKECLRGASKSYRLWLQKELTRVGKLDLLEPE
jgi:hypothetical protein